MLKEFLLGDHPLAVRQEVGEHLKYFAPELDWLPSVMQLMTLDVKHIVAKDVVHRLAPLPHFGALLAQSHPMSGRALRVLPVLS